MRQHQSRSYNDLIRDSADLSMAYWHESEICELIEAMQLRGAHTGRLNRLSSAITGELIRLLTKIAPELPHVHEAIDRSNCLRSAKRAAGKRITAAKRSR